MASIVQVKEGSTYVGSATTSQETGNFGASCTSGNWILAFGSVPASPAAAAAFTDTLGTTYSTVIAHILNGTTFIQIDAVIGQLIASGTNSVNYAAIGTDRIGALALEISGLDATPYTATDRSGWNYQAAPTTGTDLVTSGNTPTLSSADGILIGLALDAQSGSFAAPNAGTGFTDHGTGWNGIAQNYRLESKTISATTATDAVFTATADVAHHAIAIYLKNAASSATSPPPRRPFNPVYFLL